MKTSFRFCAAIAAGALACCAPDAFADITADSYVQVGLVGHFDGIENAGAGQHDNAATTWADLAGGIGNATCACDTVVWRDNCWTNNSDGTPFVVGNAFAQVLSTKCFTLEVRAMPSRTGSRETIIGNHSAGQNFNLEHNSGSVTDGHIRFYCNGAPDWMTPVKVVKDQTVTAAFVAPQGGYPMAYADGTLAGTHTAKITAAMTAGHGTVFGGECSRASMAFRGAFYSVRIYDRALSAGDIAFNAAIDKIRFEGADPAELTWPEGYRYNGETGKFEINALVSAVDGVEVSIDGGATWATSVRSWVERGSQITVNVRAPDGARVYLLEGDGALSDDETTAVLTIDTPLANVFKAGATITWQNHADRASHYWDDVTQWKDEYGVNRLPAEGDIVVIPGQRNYPYGGSTITVTNTTPRFKRVTIGRGRYVSLRNWMTQFRADEIILNGDSARNAVINCPGDFKSDAMSNRVWIVAGRLALSNQYSSVSARGYYKKYGPGWEGVASPSGGGAHGGKAAGGTCRPYGSVTEPTDPGTGTWNDNNDGYGGGAIRIEVGELLVNGSISTTGGKNLYNGGNGSGGSVWITCETITGTGSVSANGGGGVSDYSGGGGGGGGRVSVNYDPQKQALVDCQVSFAARGGLERSSTSYQRYNSCGNCGTLYFTDDIFLRRPTMKLAGIVYYGPDVTPVSSFSGESRTLENTWLVITNDNAEVDFTGDLTLKGSSARMNGLQLTGRKARVNIGGNLYLSGAQLRMDAGDSVTVAGDVVALDGTSAVNSGELNFRPAPTNDNDTAVRKVTIGGDFILNSYGGYIPRCDPTNGAVVSLHVRNFTVCSNATVYANQSGYNSTGHGPGFPTGWTRGASHGGRGGVSKGGEYGGRATYDDVKYPCMPGSCARDTGSNGVGAGGGVVLIETLGRFRLDGTVTANGSSGGIWYGGSSGGAVQIHCKGKLSGCGSISANGGVAGGTDGVRGGGGAGGRVAIWYGSKDGAATLTAEANGGYGDETIFGLAGEDGTVYWRQTSGLILFVK